jgi:hypothetical protein
MMRCCMSSKRFLPVEDWKACLIPGNIKGNNAAGTRYDFEA